MEGAKHFKTPVLKLILFVAIGFTISAVYLILEAERLKAEAFNSIGQARSFHFNDLEENFACVVP